MAVTCPGTTAVSGLSHSGTPGARTSPVCARRNTARTSDTPYNHYSMLGTIEDAWKLGCLANTCDTANVPRMTDLVGPKG